MGRIIPFHADRHRHVQELLPWYATGSLDAEDRATVDTHLAACASCRNELAGERALKDAIAAVPLDIAHGWSTLRHRLEASAPTRRRAGGLAMLRELRSKPPRGSGWALGAQAAAVALVIGIAGVSLNGRPGTYHTMSSPAPVAAGNLIVMFSRQPGRTDMERLFDRLGAHLEKGPTAAGAYVLTVPAAARPGALAILRARGDIEMAEPIDADSRP